MPANTDAYAPTTVWVTFYDPKPAVPATSTTPAVHRALDSVESDLYGVQSVARFNQLLVSVSARILSPPRRKPDPNQAVDPFSAMWSFDLEFQDPDGSAAEILSYFLGEGVPIDVEFGYQDDPAEKMVRLSGVIRSRELSLDGMDGMGIKVQAITALAYETRARERSPMAFPTGQDVRDVMQTVARDFGWPASRLIVQPGAKLTREARFDGRVDIFQFIREDVSSSLGPPPSGDTGEPYQFYVGPDKYIHFHQPGWAGNTQGSGESVEVVARVPDGSVLGCRVSSDYFTVAQMGMAQAIEAAWDRRNATTDQAKTAADTRGTSGIGTEDALVFGTRVAPYLPIHATTHEERVAKTRFYFERLKRQAININLRLRGRSDINLFDQFRFTYPRSDGTAHYISGVYTAMSVAHSLSDEGWITEVTGYRLSFGSADPALQAAAAEAKEARARDEAKRQADEAVAKAAKQEENLRAFKVQNELPIQRTPAPAIPSATSNFGFNPYGGP